MHIHLPKAVHDWREFAKEILVIVVGVLIALGFEQIVEELHWWHKVADGEERFKIEGGQMIRTAAEQVVIAPCVIGQYRKLRERVLHSGTVLDPAPLVPQGSTTAFTGADGTVIRAPSRLLTPAVWDSLRQDGTVLHMPALRQRRIAMLYSLVTIANDAVAGRAAPRVLADPIPLDPAMRVALLEQIDQAQRNFLTGINAHVQIMGGLRDLGMAPAAAEIDDYIRRKDGGDLMQFCTNLGFHFADWKAELAKVPTYEKLGL